MAANERPISNLFKLADVNYPFTATVSDKVIGGYQSEAKDLAFMRNDNFKRLNGFKHEEIIDYWKKRILTKPTNPANPNDGPHWFLEARRLAYDDVFNMIKDLYEYVYVKYLEGGFPDRNCKEIAVMISNGVRKNAQIALERMFPTESIELALDVINLKNVAERLPK